MIRRLVFMYLCIMLTNCTTSNTALKHAEISVAYVVNPRLEQLSQQDILKVLDKIKLVTQQRLDLKLTFKPLHITSIHDLFQPYQQNIRSDAQMQSFMLKPEQHSKEVLYHGFIATFDQLSLEEIIAGVKNQTNSHEIDTSKSRQDILQQIAYLHIDKLMKIKSIKVKYDHKDLLQDDLYNEYIAWDYIINQQSKYDLIITNQLIASAEAYYPTVHTSLRGGITSGFAAKSHTSYDGAIVMTTYPFISSTPFFQQARGRNYSRQEMIDTIAYTAVHELGHLFKYRKHYYDHPSCVMRPAPGLHYLEWMKEVKQSKKCLKKHDIYWKDYFSNQGS